MLTYGGWDHASSRIRAAQYVPLLEQEGQFEVRWMPRVPDGAGRLRTAVSKRWRAFRRAAALGTGQWDIVFVQRLFLPAWLLRWTQRRGIPLLYDLDDALYLNSPAQPRAEAQAAAMVRAARRVVVSTPELVPFCEAHGASPRVIPTPVDTDRIRPAARRDTEPLIIGWIGSPWTTPYLQTVAGALRRVAAERPVRFLFVGADPGGLDLPGVPVEHAPWSYEGEPAALSRMAVGIMPLPDDPWTRGKGGYKLLLYMAAGLPVVASPVGINREIVRPGETGFLADDEEAWVAALFRLCDDAALREAMGRAGRAAVRARYSRAVCFGHLDRVLEEALSPAHADLLSR
jgi:glycosyltransferase involved in cell wall biosynthesis